MTTDRRCLLLGLFAVLATACGSPDQTADADLATVRYTTTMAPFEAIIGSVVGRRGSVERLLAGGASPHTHDTRPSQVRASTQSRALFFGARTLDGWATELDAPRKIALLSMVPDSLVLTMPSDPPDDVDPHFWTDPLAVAALLPVLVDTLCVLDTTGCTTYRSNANDFAEEITRTHRTADSLLAPHRGTTVMLSQPFFRYFLHRYGFDVVGIVEPAPGKEPSPRGVQTLVDEARQRGTRAIFTMPQLPDRSARAVAEAADVPLVQLDPIGGMQGRDNYDEIVLRNARTIEEALQ